MKKLLFLTIILFSAFAAFAQYPSKNNTYGVWANRFKPDSALHVPRKYAFVRNDADTTPQVFVKGDSLYYYSRGNYYGVAGGVSIDTTSLSNRVNGKVDTATLTYKLGSYLLIPAGNSTQYINGLGQLATLPTAPVPVNITGSLGIVVTGSYPNINIQLDTSGVTGYFLLKKDSTGTGYVTHTALKDSLNRVVGNATWEHTMTVPDGDTLRNDHSIYNYGHMWEMYGYGPTGIGGVTAHFDTNYAFLNNQGNITPSRGFYNEFDLFPNKSVLRYNYYINNPTPIEVSDHSLQLDSTGVGLLFGASTNNPSIIKPFWVDSAGRTRFLTKYNNPAGLVILGKDTTGRGEIIHLKPSDIVSAGGGSLTPPNTPGYYWNGYKSFARLNMDSIADGTTNFGWSAGDISTGYGLSAFAALPGKYITLFADTNSVTSQQTARRIADSAATAIPTLQTTLTNNNITTNNAIFQSSTTYNTVGPHKMVFNLNGADSAYIGGGATLNISPYQLNLYANNGIKFNQSPGFAFGKKLYFQGSGSGTTYLIPADPGTNTYNDTLPATSGNIITYKTTATGSYYTIGNTQYWTCSTYANMAASLTTNTSISQQFFVANDTVNAGGYPAQYAYSYYSGIWNLTKFVQQ